jgi:hypothetical protein
MTKPCTRILAVGLFIALVSLLVSCADYLPTPRPTVAQEPVGTSVMYAIEIAVTQTASAVFAMETQIIEIQKTPIFEKAADLLVILPDNTWVIFSKDDLAGLPLTSIEKNGQEIKRVSLVAIVKWTKISDYTRISLLGSGGTLTLLGEKIHQHGLILFANSETGYHGKYLLDGSEWLGTISIIKIEK